MYLLYESDESDEYETYLNILEDLCQHQVKVIEGPYAYTESGYDDLVDHYFLRILIQYDGYYGTLDFEDFYDKYGKRLELYLGIYLVLNDDSIGQYFLDGVIHIKGYSFSDFKKFWKELPKECKNDSKIKRLASSSDLRCIKASFKQSMSKVHYELLSRS